MALVPYTIACLGFPRFLGLAIDWTMFETTLPSGKQRCATRSCASSPSLVRGGRCRCCAGGL
jgi:hypothetical protein